MWQAMAAATGRERERTGSAVQLLSPSCQCRPVRKLHPSLYATQFQHLQEDRAVDTATQSKTHSTLLQKKHRKETDNNITQPITNTQGYHMLHLLLYMLILNLLIYRKPVPTTLKAGNLQTHISRCQVCMKRT